MHRRKFISIGGTTITGISLFPAPIINFNLAENSNPPLLESFLPPTTIELIGKTYLQKHALPDYTFDLNLNNSEIAHRVRKDFEEDRTIVVAGWVLSITEAMRCAAIHLKK